MIYFDWLQFLYTVVPGLLQLGLLQLSPISNISKLTDFLLYNRGGLLQLFLVKVRLIATKNVRSQRKISSFFCHIRWEEFTANFQNAFSICLCDQFTLACIFLTQTAFRQQTSLFDFFPKMWTLWTLQFSMVFFFWQVSAPWRFCRVSFSTHPFCHSL